MAEIDLTILNDGDPGTAASLNTPMAAIEGGINEVEGYALRKGALNHEHLPSVADILTIKRNGLNFLTHSYTAKWSFGNDNLDDGLGGDAWWVVINDGVNGAFEITAPGDFTQFELGMSNGDQYAGVLILLNVHVVLTQLLEAGDPLGSNVAAVTGIQVRQSGDPTWYTHSRATRLCSDRYTTDYHNTYQDMPTRFLITDADLGTYGAGAGIPITGIRAVVSGYNPAGGPLFPYVLLRECRMTILRLRAGGLS